MPKSRLEFWKPKLDKNRERDLANQKALRKLGWKVLIVWACQLDHVERLEKRIAKFLA